MTTATPLGGHLAGTQVVLDLDEVELLCALARIDELPVVLALNGRHDHADARVSALASAAESLQARGLMSGFVGNVADLVAGVDPVDRVASGAEAAIQAGMHPELVRWLSVLAQPKPEVAVRWFSTEHPDHVGRLCVAQTGQDESAADRAMAIVALRTPNSLVLRHVPGNGSAQVLDSLPPCPPLDFGRVNAPTDDLRAALDKHLDPRDLTAALRRLGTSQHDAAVVGSAITRCTSRVEAVAVAHEDGRTRRSPGAVALFDTEFGRIAAIPSVSADGTNWSTLGPGTDQRIATAIDILTESLHQGSDRAPRSAH